jgi:hypothetical protein
MATKSASPEVSGARKRKLSNKASTNGDPLEARKRNKTLSAVKKGVTAALTKKKRLLPCLLPKQQPELQR